ncbi:hypothetical protein AVEN_94523-1 [Araneus ventricosus]|uniref:Uncharacterized protein n=1 Tax=Araneus ventricosus TaxID=182803 RepID=A0A4Y2FTR8_ARAVE|nr:hypothetical protein AVEN_94523-1 [Araneus ventricosus]
MSDGEIITQVQKSNSDDNDTESDEDEVIETSKISNSDAFECFAKGLILLEQQIVSYSTELTLLKQLRDRAVSDAYGRAKIRLSQCNVCIVCHIVSYMYVL